MNAFTKKTLFFTLILILTLGAFSACSSDNDDKGSLSARVVGTYVGDLTSIPYSGEVSVVVTVASANQVLITFDAVSTIEPFTVKLTDTGVQGIIQSSVNPICQFQTQVGGVIINNTTKIYTFSGSKQ